MSASPVLLDFLEHCIFVGCWTSIYLIIFLQTSLMIGYRLRIAGLFRIFLIALFAYLPGYILFYSFAPRLVTQEDRFSVDPFQWAFSIPVAICWAVSGIFRFHSFFVLATLALTVIADYIYFLVHSHTGISRPVPSRAAVSFFLATILGAAALKDERERRGLVGVVLAGTNFALFLETVKYGYLGGTVGWLEWAGTLGVAVGVALVGSSVVGKASDVNSEQDWEHKDKQD